MSDRHRVDFTRGGLTGIVQDGVVALVDAAVDAPVVEALRPVGQIPLDQVLEAVAALQFHAVPSFGIVEWEGDLCRIVLRGEMTAAVCDDRTSAEVVIDGSGTRTWAEHVLADASEVRLYPSTVPPTEEAMYQVAGGLVPAGSIFAARPDPDEPIGAAHSGHQEGQPSKSAEAPVASVPDEDPVSAPAALIEAPPLRDDLEGGAAPDVLSDLGQTIIEVPELIPSPPGPREESSSGQPTATADPDISGGGGEPAPDGQDRSRVTEPVSGAEESQLGAPEPVSGEIAPVVIDVEPAAARSDPAPPPAASPTKAPVVTEADAGEYDHLFGATEHRSVEAAAVRHEDDPAPEVDPAPPSPAPAPVPAPSTGLDSDHDGMTMTIGELRRTMEGDRPAMIGAGAEVVPTPTPSSPVSGGGPAGSGEGAESGQVMASLCQSGHLNPPHAGACRVCGGAVSADAVPVDRPVLGRFVFSTGQLVPVNGPLLIGRSPRLNGPVSDVLPELLSVPSPQQDISRTHVEIRIEDWQVLVIDKGSTNGTLVMLEGRPPQRLRADEPFPLPVGGRVSLAEEVEFVYEAAT